MVLIFEAPQILSGPYLLVFPYGKVCPPEDKPFRFIMGFQKRAASTLFLISGTTHHFMRRS
jgi:hypothetical protein